MEYALVQGYNVRAAVAEYCLEFYRHGGFSKRATKQANYKEKNGITLLRGYAALSKILPCDL